MLVNSPKSSGELHSSTKAKALLDWSFRSLNGIPPGASAPAKLAALHRRHPYWSSIRMGGVACALLCQVSVASCLLHSRAGSVTEQRARRYDDCCILAPARGRVIGYILPRRLASMWTCPRWHYTISAYACLSVSQYSSSSCQGVPTDAVTHE